MIFGSKDNEKAEFFKKKNNYDFVIKNDYRYLGRFLGKKAETEWLVSKIDSWIEAVEQVVEMEKIRTIAGLHRNVMDSKTRMEFYTLGSP